MAIATGTALLGGAMLGSAALGARASRKAASTQAEAAREGMDAQERMFERQLELQEPFRQSGLEAQNMLMRELRNPQQYRPTGSTAAMVPRPRASGGGVAGAIRSAARGGLLPAGLDPRAAAADPEGYQRMLQGAREQEARMPGSTMFSQGGGVSLAPGDIAQQRFQQSAGLSPAEIAAQRFQASAGLSPAEIANRQFQQSQGLSPAEIANRQFQQSQGLSPGELGTEQFNFQADPGYGFRMSEGLKALERSAAARGGLVSGGAGKALQRYGQDLASQEYGNAFQRFQQDRAARAGLGQMEYGRFADEQARRAAAGQTEYGRFADEQARRAAAGMQEFGQFTDLMGRRTAAGQTEYGRFADDMSRRQALGAMEYGQFAGERSARLLPLMQQVQAGQGLTSNIAGQMAGLGAAQAGAAGQIGAAQAAGRIGQANALMGGFGQGANLYMQNQFMNRYFGGGADPGVTRTLYTPGPPAFGSSAYESQYGMMP